MFYSADGSTFNVTCAIAAHPDVATGVRATFWYQSMILVFLSLFELLPTEVVIANFSSQVLTTAIMATAASSSEIDVPNTLIASLFCVAFSISRITTHDIPLSNLTTKRAIKITSWIYIFDLVLRLLIVTFNYVVWLNIMRLQNDHTICPEGVGKAAFFNLPVDMRDLSWVSISAIVYSILDLAWEVFRIIAECKRSWIIEYNSKFKNASPLSPAEQLGIDPRIWLLRRIFSLPSPKPNVDDEDPELATRLFLKRFGKRFLLVALPKYFALIFIFVTTENILAENGLWEPLQVSVAELFSLINSVSLLYVFLARNLWLYRRLGLIPSDMTSLRIRLALFYPLVMFTSLNLSVRKATELRERFEGIWAWTIFVLVLVSGLGAGFLCYVGLIIMMEVIGHLFEFFHVWKFLGLLFLPFVRLIGYAICDTEQKQDNDMKSNDNEEEAQSLINNVDIPAGSHHEST